MTDKEIVARYIENELSAARFDWSNRRRDASVEALAALDRMAEREKRLESVIRWALGEKDTFPVRPEDAGLFWWRSELRLRSGLFPEDETGGQAVEQSSTKEGGDANCAKHTAASDNTTGASTVTESAKPDSLTSDAAPVFEGGSNPSQDAGAATPASWRKLVESGEWPEYEAATPAGTPPTHITVGPECPTCSNPAHLDGDGKMLVVGGRIAAALEGIAAKLEVLIDLRRC